MKKLSLFFLILTLSFLAISPLIINPVKAQTTYNWIQNSGFDDSDPNIVVNGSFETGDFTGYTHSGCTILTSNPYEGTYDCEIGGGAQWVQQNFSSVQVFSTTEFYVYVKLFSGLNAAFYYSDGSNNNVYYYGSDMIWTRKNLNDSVVDGKYLNAIRFSGANIALIDKLVLNSGTNGQTTITPTTTPWFCDVAVGTHYPDIVDDISNTSPNSCYFEIGSQHYNALYQVISNLDSDSVTNFTLYALDASGSGGGSLNVKLHYSDGSWSSSQPTPINSSWIQYNFSYLIVPHKIIDEIYIKPTDYSGSDIYIDTISLLSTNPVTYISFSFDLSPSALWINNYPTGYRLMEFGSFENQAYVVTCTMYNNSIPSGNGTFLVTSSLASLSGTILNGIFSFNIAQRSVPVNNTIELFNIEVTSNLFNTSVNIKGYWYKLDVTNPADPNHATEKTNQFVDAFPIMLIMALFIIPATYYLGVGGFIGGFSIASIVCVWTGIAPPWFIAITVLTDLVMIFFATRQKNSTSEV